MEAKRMGCRCSKVLARGVERSEMGLDVGMKGRESGKDWVG